MHAILKDGERRGICIRLKHNTLHEDRLAEAMHIRNMRSAGTGLYHWSHKCAECRVVVQQGSNGAECEFESFTTKKNP